MSEERVLTLSASRLFSTFLNKTERLAVFLSLSSPHFTAGVILFTSFLARTSAMGSFGGKSKKNLVDVKNLPQVVDMLL